MVFAMVVGSCDNIQMYTHVDLLATETSLNFLAQPLCSFVLAYMCIWHLLSFKHFCRSLWAVLSLFKDFVKKWSRVSTKNWTTLAVSSLLCTSQPTRCSLKHIPWPIPAFAAGYKARTWSRRRHCVTISSSDDLVRRTRWLTVDNEATRARVPTSHAVFGETRELRERWHLCPLQRP